MMIVQRLTTKLYICLAYNIISPDKSLPSLDRPTAMGMRSPSSRPFLGWLRRCLDGGLFLLVRKEVDNGSPSSSFSGVAAIAGEAHRLREPLVTGDSCSVGLRRRQRAAAPPQPPQRRPFIHSEATAQHLHFLLMFCVNVAWKSFMFLMSHFPTPTATHY